MNARVEIRNGINGQWINYSSFVILPLSFPFIKRNKDYSLVLRETEIRLLLKTWNGQLPNPNMHTKGSPVNIYVNNILRFAGYISRIEIDIERKCYRIFIKENLNKLNDKSLTIDKITTPINWGNPTPQELYIDGNGFIYIQMLYLLRYLFYGAYLQLNTSHLNNILWRAYDGQNYLQDIYYRHLKFDLRMFNAWNMPDSIHRNIISSNPKDYNDSRITYFDAVSYICSVFGFTIYMNPSGSYTLAQYENPSTRNYSINPSQTYSYDIEDEENEINSTSGMSALYTLGDVENSGAINIAQDRQPYYLTNKVTKPREVMQLVVGEGIEQINMMKHFCIIMQNGDSNPPLHNLVNTIKPWDAVIHQTRPRYLPHKVESFRMPLNFEKPLVLENEIVIDKGNIYSRIKQEDLYVF